MFIISTLHVHLQYNYQNEKVLKEFILLLHISTLKSQHTAFIIVHKKSQNSYFHVMYTY